MGYYTYHSIEVQNLNGTTNTEEDWEQLISDDSEYANWGTNVFEEAMKWYESDNDMKEFSKKHPNLLFILHGEGENNDDIWITYYRNGKAQHCPAIITFDAFDESKLE